MRRFYIRVKGDPKVIGTIIEGDRSLDLECLPADGRILKKADFPELYNIYIRSLSLVIPNLKYQIWSNTSILEKDLKLSIRLVYQTITILN